MVKMLTQIVWQMKIQSRFHMTSNLWDGFISVWSMWHPLIDRVGASDWAQAAQLRE